jgi:arylsulfatase
VSGAFARIRRALALAAALAGCGTTPPPAVLLVTIDTLRADHLGCHGYPRPTSPVVDALAAGGVRFATARSQASLTAPSHASILSGTLPAWHQVRTNGDVLPAQVDTLAKWFRAAGWRTAGFVSNAVITGVVGFDEGFEHFDDRLDAIEATRPQPERVATATVDAALAWLGAHRSERFFVWLHLEDPHGPYVPPAADAAPFLAAAASEPRRALSILTDDSGRDGIPRYQAVGGETDAAAYVARYDGEIRYFDRELGRVLAALREWGIAPFVVLTADHGEALGEGGYWFAHGHALTEDQLRVPLILHGPGVPAGRVVSAPVDTLDIAPTILRRAGLAVPRTLVGRDLLARELAPRPTFAQAFPDGAAVIDGGLALYAGAGETVLHDLTAGPNGVRDDVAARDRLAALLAAERARPAPPWPRRSARGDLLREQLRALGYIE